MNIYRLLSWANRIRNPRVKLLGLWWLHVTHRRYLGIFMDPVLSCNLRCQMCYFSDPERRKELHGVMSAAEVESLAKALFHRALKLQIGCGAEPTIYRDLTEVVRWGQRCGVPHIALTTNGNLLDEERLQELVDAGLNELTLSLHGITRETYERLMTGGIFERFLDVLAAARAVKSRHAAFSVRINYTMNADNVEELAQLPQLLRDVPVATLQLRPVQRIGNTAYTNFSMEQLQADYDRTIMPVVRWAHERGIRCLYPTREQLCVLQPSEEAASNKPKQPKASELCEQALQMLTYCNLTPGHAWAEGFDMTKDTFESYSRRTHRARNILALALGHRPAAARNFLTKTLNYTIE